MTTHDPRAQVLADALETAHPLLTRFLVGFDDSNHTRQAPGIPNHVAWILGHLALYHHRAADRVLGHDDPQPLPQPDFISGDGRSGTRERIDTESVCNGSVPIDDPSIYPTFERLMQIHDTALNRLIETTRTADSAMLDRMVNWGAPFQAQKLIIRMVMHMGTHAGQITDLRRGLGMGSVLG